MSSSNGSREAVLARIREALKTPAHRPAPAQNSPIFQPANPDMIGSFRLQCRSNLVDCLLTASRSETVDALNQVLASLPAGEVFAQDSTELRELLADCHCSLRWSCQGAANEAAQVTITHCEALVASTGTIVVSSQNGGRGGSVVAPVHVVVAKASQLLPDLDSAFSHLGHIGMPPRNSFIGFITGCSRTADIEKILVIGAHGPKRVVVILEQDTER